MIPRRLNNSMSNNEYRIDLNNENSNIEDIETIEEELINQVQQTTRPNLTTNNINN
ncbi:unnamed protein product, partial [Rotaria sp. Silwood1]